MGVRIIHGDDYAVLYCSTSMWAFGPVFENAEEAESFCQWWNRRNPARDLRMLTDAELSTAKCEWSVWRDDHKPFEEDCRRCGEAIEKAEPEAQHVCDECLRLDWHEADELPEHDDMIES